MELEGQSCKVFISYNQRDRDWAEWIAAVIETAGYLPILQAWHFRPGENFILRMQQATAEADMTLAVLSEAYLRALYTQPEWAAAFREDPTGEKRRLIPVRVSSCEVSGMFAQIIDINLVGLNEPEAERALLDGLKPTGKPIEFPSFPGQQAQAGSGHAPFPRNVARLHGVPDLPPPPHYLVRSAELDDLKRNVLGDSNNLGITGFGNLGVEGMGGIGKTVLTAALAHDSEVRAAFPDGIFWLTLGREPKLAELQVELAEELTGHKFSNVSLTKGKDVLREALEGRRVLVVLDDVWTTDQGDAFVVTAPPARFLITTRNRDVLVGLGAEEHCINVLSPTAALLMLAGWAGEKSVDMLPPIAAEVAEECGYLPLALAMIGAMVHLRPTAWRDALTRLRRADLNAIKRDFPGYPYPDLLRALEVSVEALDSADRERYLDIAIFPEDQLIPEGILRMTWNLDEVDTRKCMSRFVARSLATRSVNADGDEALLLHDLQFDLIRKHREIELSRLHSRLIDRWGDLMRLPDAYAWRWVTWHLKKAGRLKQLRELLFTFEWMKRNIEATDANALIADYDHLSDAEDTRDVQSAIRLSVHVLERDRHEFAGQLIGRLFGSDLDSIQALLKQASEWKAHPWLRPLRSSLRGPGDPVIRTLRVPCGLRSQGTGHHTRRAVCHFRTMGSQQGSVSYDTDSVGSP